MHRVRWLCRRLMAGCTGSGRRRFRYARRRRLGRLLMRFLKRLRRTWLVMMTIRLLSIVVMLLRPLVRLACRRVRPLDWFRLMFLLRLRRLFCWYRYPFVCRCDLVFVSLRWDLVMTAWVVTMVMVLLMNLWWLICYMCCSVSWLFVRFGLDRRLYCRRPCRPCCRG